MSEATRVLHEVADPERLLALVYDELRRLASAKLAREAPGQTLQPTALVHEAWLRLSQNSRAEWQNRDQFYAIAAETMRRILVDRARRRRASKHGGEFKRTGLPEIEVALPADQDVVLQVHEALAQLEREDPEKAQVVKLRFFVGLEHAEIAALMGVSEKTVQRYWTFAKASALFLRSLRLRCMGCAVRWRGQGGKDKEHQMEPRHPASIKESTKLERQSAVRTSAGHAIHDFLAEVLFARDRSPAIPPSDDLYGWLIGSWELEIVACDDDGEVTKSTGEAHFAWVLEGRAVQDVFINPRRSDRGPQAPKFANWYGTTLRIYDASIGAWRVNWFNPHDGVRAELIGRRQGNDIVQEGEFPDGTPIRWCFSEIAENSCLWRGERREPDGTWRLQVEFRAKRTA